MQTLNIIIEDWTGKKLYVGPYDHVDVDRVLDANRCPKCTPLNILETCTTCDGTGYFGDFEVYWENSKEKSNVYECINY